MQIINCLKCGLELGYINLKSGQVYDRVPTGNQPEALLFNISDRSNEICPVCLGRRTVPAGFYTEGATEPETCRSCSGVGYISVPKTITCPDCGEKNGIY